jgi:hypothetical protein
MEYVSVIRKLDEFKFRQEILEIINTVGFDSNQIICQGQSADGTDWKTGVGRIRDLEDRDEQHYKYLNPALAGTMLADIIEEYGCFRTRIMLMSPRSCYSIHADFTPRLHIPVVTNTQAWMVWPYLNKCYQMKVGNIYFADTTKTHTFLNGDGTDRIHIVAGIKSCPKK